MLVAGRYEGMDARVESEYADMIHLCRDFVLMGGDLAALAVLESVLRLVPGVVGKTESVTDDSFSGALWNILIILNRLFGKATRYPSYQIGQPCCHERMAIKPAAHKTVIHHFDWLRKHHLDDRQLQLAQDYILIIIAALLQ